MRKDKGYVTEKLCYPIIVQLKNNVSVSFLNEKVFTTCYKKSFNSQDYINARIIDSVGNEFSVKDVVNQGYVNELFGLDIFLGSRIYIGIFLERIRLLNIDEFKREALKIVSANVDSYVSGGLKVKDVKMKIKNATGIDEISRLLLP